MIRETAARTNRHQGVIADAKLDAKSHLPAVEDTFTRTDRHESGRRAKVGQHDNPNAPDPLPKPKAKAVVMPT